MGKKRTFKRETIYSRAIVFAINAPYDRCYYTVHKKLTEKIEGVSFIGERKNRNDIGLKWGK